MPFSRDKWCFLVEFSNSAGHVVSWHEKTYSSHRQTRAKAADKCAAWAKEHAAPHGWGWQVFAVWFGHARSSK